MNSPVHDWEHSLSSRSVLMMCDGFDHCSVEHGPDSPWGGGELLLGWGFVWGAAGQFRVLADHWAHQTFPVLLIQADCNYGQLATIKQFQDLVCCNEWSLGVLLVDGMLARVSFCQVCWQLVCGCWNGNMPLWCFTLSISTRFNVFTSVKFLNSQLPITIRSLTTARFKTLLYLLGCEH